MRELAPSIVTVAELKPWKRPDEFAEPMISSPPLRTLSVPLPVLAPDWPMLRLLDAKPASLIVQREPDPVTVTLPVEPVCCATRLDRLVMVAPFSIVSVPAPPLLRPTRTAPVMAAVVPAPLNVA